jgi:hypothetical protein
MTAPATRQTNMMTKLITTSACPFQSQGANFS